MTATKKPKKPKAKKAGRAATRKPAATRRKKADQTQPAAADAPPVVVDVPLSRVDLSVCDRVRAKTHPDRVERYRERYADHRPMDPVHLFGTLGADGGADPDQPVWCGDGGHRVRAKRVSETGPDIPAVLSLHPTPELALAAAWRCAARANEAHGLTRSHYDVRAAVRAVLAEFPELAAGSDRAVAEYCDCNRIVVVKARKELTAEGVLTGKASAEGRYKADEPAPPKPHSDHAPPAKADPPTTREAPLVVVDAEGEPGEAPPAIKDQFGRPVPDTLSGVFLAAGMVRAVLGRMSEVGAGLAAVRRAGVPVPDSLNSAGVEGAIHDLKGCEPACVCPACDGEGRQGKRACLVCAGPGAVDGTGWLSRRQFERLNTDQQDICRGPWG